MKILKSIAFTLPALAVVWAVSFIGHKIGFQVPVKNDQWFDVPYVLTSAILIVGGVAFAVFNIIKIWETPKY